MVLDIISLLYLNMFWKSFPSIADFLSPVKYVDHLLVRDVRKAN
jgi:hypothetical protein